MHNTMKPDYFAAPEVYFDLGGGGVFTDELVPLFFDVMDDISYPIKYNRFCVFL
jgi:hypothetical protein